MGSTSQGRTLVGCFVGGRASRMGGRCKALLTHPHGAGSLLAHHRHCATAAGCDLVLVGRSEVLAFHPDARGLPWLEDLPGWKGPVGALAALLDAGHKQGFSWVIPLACDMPHVTPELLSALAGHPSKAKALAARVDGLPQFEPFLARYEPRSVGAVLQGPSGVSLRSLRGLLALLEPEVWEAPDLRPSPWHDWDTPEDCRV